MSKAALGVIAAPGILTGIYANVAGGVSLAGSIGIGFASGILGPVGAVVGGFAGAALADLVPTNSQDEKMGPMTVFGLLGGIAGGAAGIWFGYNAIANNATTQQEEQTQVIEQTIEAGQSGLSSYTKNADGNYVLPSKKTPVLDV